MEKFITLNHLKKAVDALLLKINNEKQYYVEKTSVEAASSEGYLIGSVGGIDLYAPSNLLTQNDLNDIYNYIENYFDNSPFLTGNEVFDANDYVNKRLCLKTININNGGNLYLYFPNNSEHGNTTFVFTLGTKTTRVVAGYTITIYTDRDGQYGSFNSHNYSMTVIDKKGQTQSVLKNKTIYFLSWTSNSPYVATFTELDMVSSSDLSEAITNALSNITGFSAEVVNQLPATGELGVFYFVSNSGSGNNIYDEYIYVNNSWEKIGTTEVDLSNYLQKTDIAAWAKAANKPTYTATEVGAIANTEPAASITQTDINNWTKKSNLFTVSSDHSGSDYWWELKIDRSNLFTLSNSPGNDGYLRSIDLPVNNGSAYATLQFPTASGKLALVSDIYSTVPAWARAATKPTYTASEVGALPATTVIPTIPTNVSAFNNDAGYLTSFTETDPTVPAWAKEENKPTYTALEVGAIADTAPAAAITQANINSWNSKLDSFTETDPTVPAWAKQSTKPTYTASEIGALPDTTVIPNKINDLTTYYNFGIGYVDCTNTRRYIFVSNVTFNQNNASTFSSYFLLMFIRGTENSGNVTIAGTGNFKFYNINNNSEVGYEASISSATIATLKYGTLYIARLNDGDLNLYPLATSQEINTKISQINKLITTAGVNDTEYNLIGTETSNNNTSTVNLYNPSLISFAKSTNFARLTLGDSSIPGVARIYSTSGGFTDIKSGSSSTTERTITFPDASGTVALTSNIPNVPSWALAANKPTYTASEVGAVTSSEVSSMIGTAVGNITSFSAEIVQTLPSTGVAGRIYFKLGNDHTNDIYEEYIYVNNAWEKLGNFDASQIDLTDYLKKTDLAAWAKASTKPSYTASEVGALSTSTQYVSTFNGQSGAITYIAPVTSVNGQTGAVSLDIPNVPNWALATNKPSYTASEVGALASTAPAAAITQANITAWNNKADTNTTYSLSISGTRITLTPSSGSATYVDLPVYDGGII